MDIKELEDYRLSDAVKFHTHLNPRIWGRDEHLRPEVREKLLEIAEYFQEFLGLNDLKVKDITISGSNAAYTYTDHSDIDLHLVVEIPPDPVYRELFDAKKYEFNDTHDIRIGGYDVELYVQDANKTHASQGIYSVINNKWVSVPKRRKPDINDISVKSKYEDLGNRIEAAIKSGNAAQLEQLGSKVREFRQAGLDQTGEFGPENLAFKVLRSNGTLDLLRAARQAAKNQELSIAEAGKKKKKKSFRYGFGGYYSPGYNYYGQTDAADGGGGDGGESVKESADSIDLQLQNFVKFCADRLELQQIPRIQIKRDPEWSRRNSSFGQYSPDTDVLMVSIANRHPMDVMRTVAHELTHRMQDEQEHMPDHAGDTGSDWENQANALAGVLMRDFAEQRPEYFSQDAISEAAGYIPVNKKEARDPRYSMAVTQDIRPGEPQRQAAKLGWRTNPAGTPPVARTNGLVESLTRRLQAVKQGSRHMPSRWQDIWQLNGQVSTDQWCELIENYHLGKTILKESVEESIVKKINQLIDNFSCDTQVGHNYIPVFLVGINNHISYYDVDGNSPATKPAEFLILARINNQQLTFKDNDGKQFTYPDSRLSDISYAAVLALDSIEKYNQLRIWLKLQDGTELPAALPQQITEQEQELAEVAMSPSALRAFAASPAATGMKAGFEAELVFTGAGANDEEDEWLPDYSDDPRAYSMDDIRDFFNSGDFAEGLSRQNEKALEQDFYEWSDQALYDDFDAAAAVREWIKENDWDEEDLIRSALDDEYSKDRVEEILAAMERRVDGTGTAADADLVEEYVAAEQEVNQQLDQRVAQAVEEQDSDFESALDEFRENWDRDESDWLSDRGWRTMNDIADNFDFQWPRYTLTGGGSGEGGFNEEAAQRLANDLSDSLGVETTVNSGYHGGQRDATTWIFEPDGSLDADDDADMPVEIVSPPMPLTKTLEILPKFFEWVESQYGYANSSTGFHMSVSMPDHAGASLDYTKLALFLGDEYVLQQFGRAANIYAASAVGKIQSRMTGPSFDGNLRADVVLSAMREQLNQLATTAVATPSGFGKYTSINPKTNYIEFRSAGGSDYFKDMDRIQNTLMRYARAMSIAFDPDAEKAEYAAKLYKLLTNTTTQQVTDPQGGTTRTQVKGKNDNDAISIFSRYVAGELPKSALKSFLKQIQYGREVAKNPPKKIQWKVTHPNRSSTITLMAATAAEAITLAKQEYNDTMNPDDAYRAEPVAPATQTPATDQLNAPVADDPEGNFVLRSRQGNEGTGPVLFRFRASTNSEAIQAARQWTTARGLERMSVYLDQVTSLRPEELAARPVRATLGEPRPAFQEPRSSSIPEVPLDIAQNFPQTGGEFSGAWRVVDGLNREVHRFSDIGNDQSDANRAARAWAQQTGFDGTLEVYPVMA